MAWTDEIGGKLEEVAAENPELHHYTTFEGLKGIVTSRSLWATKYSHLNDNSEAGLLPELLRDDVLKNCRKIIQKRMKRSSELRSVVASAGGVLNAAENVTTSVIDLIHEGVFSPTNLDPDQPTLAIPFVTSFCSHRKDDEYIRQNGLLSQWRGYGEGGGYAIVFDTDGLVNALAREAYNFIYTHLDMQNVFYTNQGEQIEPVLQGLLPRIYKVCRLALGEKTGGPGDDFLNDYVQASTTIKHQGFFEEREVRIVLSPMQLGDENKLVPKVRENFDLLRRARPDASFKKIGKIPRTKRPFIEVFSANNDPLPIKRVIVGPSNNQAENIKKLEGLFSQDLIIWPSETPFVG